MPEGLRRELVVPGRARGDRPKSCDLPWWPYVRENRACVCVGCSMAGMFVSSESKKNLPSEREECGSKSSVRHMVHPLFPLLRSEKGQRN